MVTKHTFPIAAWGGHQVELYVGDTFSEAHALALNQSGAPNFPSDMATSGMSVSICSDQGARPNRILMIISTRTKPGKIVHEVIHVTRFLLEDKLGMPHNFHSCEAYAYLGDYLFDVTMDIQRKARAAHKAQAAAVREGVNTNNS